jgi:WD40 repeat protein
VESVELVHEALITRWSRLSEWFDADRAFRTWQEQLRASLAQWEAARRDEGALFRGTPLAEAQRWLTERPEDLGTPERQFIHASRALRTRSLRRLRMVVAVLTLLVLTASSLGGVALWQSKRANEKSNQAQSVALATQANALAFYQPDVAMLLAATAYQTAQTREAIDALTSIASRWRHADRLLVTDVAGISHIAFSPTDPTMIALTNNHDIELWDIKKNTRRGQRNAEGAGTPVFSRDGRILAYTQSNEHGGKVVLWPHTENQTPEISLNLAPKESATHLIFGPDDTLLGAYVGQRIQLWSSDTLRLYRSVPLTHNDTGCAFGFRNQGRELAYVDGDDIVTWDIATNRVLTRKQPVPSTRRQSSAKYSSFFDIDPIFAVAPDGRSAIYQDMAYENNVNYVSNGWWDFDHQQAQKIGPWQTKKTELGWLSSVPFAPNSHRVAVSDESGVAIFDVTKRTPIAAYPYETSTKENESFWTSFVWRCYAWT